MRPADVAQLLPGQIAALTREQLGALTAEQAGALTSNQVRALTEEQSGALPEATRRGHMTPDIVRRFEEADLRALTDTQIRNMSPAQIRALPATHLRVLNYNQLSSLSFVHGASLTREQVQSFTLAQMEPLVYYPAKYGIGKYGMENGVLHSRLNDLTPQQRDSLPFLRRRLVDEAKEMERLHRSLCIPAKMAGQSGENGLPVNGNN